MPFLCFRIKVAQQSVSKLTAEKKVETKKINPTASLVWSGFQYDIPRGLWHHSCHSECWLVSAAVGEHSIFSSNAAEWFSSQREMLKLMPYGSQQLCLTFNSSVVPKHGSAILDNKKSCFCGFFFPSTLVSCIFCHASKCIEAHCMYLSNDWSVCFFKT